MPQVIDSFRGEYKWLSNFYGGSAVYEGDTYPTAEHAYHAAKTTDPMKRKEILQARTPRKARLMGIRLPLRPGWDDLRIEVMRAILHSKFKDNKETREMLLATGDTMLIEGNDWGDQFWGQVDGIGDNHLGRILMDLRDELRAQDPKD